MVCSDLWMCLFSLIDVFIFFFKQKTAYEVRISDWSSDVCSSDLRISLLRGAFRVEQVEILLGRETAVHAPAQLSAAGLHYIPIETRRCAELRRVGQLVPPQGRAVERSFLDLRVQ